MMAKKKYKDKSRASAVSREKAREYRRWHGPFEPSPPRQESEIHFKNGSKISFLDSTYGQVLRGLSAGNIEFDKVDAVINDRDFDEVLNRIFNKTEGSDESSARTEGAAAEE